MKHKSKMKCARFLNKTGLCGLPIEFTFVNKGYYGFNILYGLCRRHAKEVGVYHVDK